jgi:PTS system mannose-specific IIB component
MAIIHVRIDDRLIHGQVAMIWTNSLSATRIMVVDDDASNSELVKMSLKLATPTSVSLSVLTIEKAASRIISGAYDGQRVLLVIRSPENLLKLIKQGVLIESANIGNQAPKGASRQLNDTVALSEASIDACRMLRKLDVKLTLKRLPTSETAEVIL